MTAAIPSGPLPNGFSFPFTVSNLAGTAVPASSYLPPPGTYMPPGGWVSNAGWYWCSGSWGIGLDYHGAWSDPLDDQAVILCSQVTS